VSGEPGQRVLDSACGSGEMLCTWARDHRIDAVGVDLSSAFVEAARTRAVEWAELRAELDSAAGEHLAAREYLGWGVFALMPR
jgi:ubiquinone/menaquinone biosynthesis C-methylase UbiE